MKRIQFTEDDIVQLKDQRLQHQHPIVRRRMMALCLKAQGLPHKDICTELSISSMCLCEYLDLYIKEGLDGLKRLGYRGKRNVLLENRDLIIAHLELQPPGTLKEAQARIEEITGIKRSLPQIRAFLKKTASYDGKSNRFPKRQTSKPRSSSAPTH
jgi:transposase